MSQLMLLMAIPGVLIVFLAIPLVLKRIPPNPIYGLRVPATFKDEQVWYDANAATGRDLVILGLCLTLLTFALPAAGVHAEAFAITWSLAIGAGGICTGVLGWTRANRMLRERQAGPR